MVQQRAVLSHACMLMPPGEMPQSAGHVSCHVLECCTPGGFPACTPPPPTRRTRAGVCGGAGSSAPADFNYSAPCPFSPPRAPCELLPLQYDSCEAS